MTNKFIEVNNKEEADRAAKYLEFLGYVLTKHTGEDEYATYTKCVSTLNECYYFSDLDGEQYDSSFCEEQILVPDDFMTQIFNQAAYDQGKHLVNNLPNGSK